MLKPLPSEQLEEIKNEISREENIKEYKFHTHPDVRALIARTKFAPQAYILDPSPEVRLGLIETNKWINRIALTEQSTRLIIAMIKQGYVLKRWRKSGDPSIKSLIQEMDDNGSIRQVS